MNVLKNSTVCVMEDGKHEGIDVEASELPVGAIHGERVRSFVGKELEDEPGDNREVKVVVRHETLDAPHARQGIRLPTEGRGELGEIDGAQYDDGLEHL